MTRIRDLLDLPDAVRKGDFVLSLARGVSHPDETVASYAITDKLVHAFDRALSIVDSALVGQRSQASYIHGSFGSGKSHFMAILDLMLQGHEAPWRRPEFHRLRAKYDWIGEKKLLQLPMHMIGAQSVEARVFETYVKWVAEHHPDADLPALYADHELFQNAVTLRANMDDDAKFFGVLNKGAGTGRLKGRSGGYTAASFERAIESADKDERAKLFARLVKTHFPAFAGQTSQFIGLDRGLGVLSRHAAGLGYDAVLLYLDELILWLAGKVSNVEFVQDEAQKLAKLKEAQDEERDVPVVSFIARQRDIGDLVGDRAAGEVRSTLRSSLEWSEGRFERVELESRNLPAVIEHRVVKARDARARATIDDTFARVRTSLGDSWGTLLGSEGQEDDFRKVYPFSPALVETLIDVSDCLQRERTAIRVLMELLVEHLRELELGEVVPIGDIFDALAGGEDAFDPIMQDRFNRAKELYRDKFLPVIRGQYGTATAERCQRERSDHPTVLGCSDCPETLCRNDNRLAKTLLLAAFVPNAKPFRNFTVSRLVQLNHGTVMSLIPGEETAEAAEKLQGWEHEISALRLGDQGDPTVHVNLESVNLEPILHSAEGADSPESRRMLVKEMLFSLMGLATDEGSTVARELEWRGSKRRGAVKFGNVRELPVNAFSCPPKEVPDASWYVIVDYPFDREGFTPQHDLDKLDEIRDQLGGKANAHDNPTLVWLPTFFSQTVEDDLKQLVLIDHILASSNARRYLGHLRPEDQARAKNDLAERRVRKKKRVEAALEQAFQLGPVRAKAGLLDPSRAVDEHLVSLAGSQLDTQPAQAPSFARALEQLATRILVHRFPQHPEFGEMVTVGKLEKVRAVLERVFEAPDHRVVLDRREAKLVRHVGEPLGLVDTGETAVALRDRGLRDIDRRRQQESVDTPTVDHVRAYNDPAGDMGLLPEVENLVVWAYAAWSGRTLVRAGRPLSLDRLNTLPGDALLQKPELPDAESWNRAIDRAGALFGISARRALNARNLEALGAALAREADQHRGSQGLPELIRMRVGAWSAYADGDVEGEPPRLETAASVARLVDGLLARDATTLERVRLLSDMQPRTSMDAMQRSLTSADAVRAELENQSHWIVFDSVRQLANDDARRHRAQEILREVASALMEDQLNRDLLAVLDTQTRAAGALIREARPARPPEPRPVDPRPPEPRPVGPRPDTVPVDADAVTRERTISGTASEIRAQVLDELEHVLASYAPDARVRVTLQLVARAETDEPRGRR